ncbi:putative MFS transporter [Actinacidiphila reveromycinica]|uniref:Putative MFS transporter n=1 Tax=Actinacidiphila reveromycinica TaxID=659352 RepID=A0A7U3VMZ7_9ACTN|nr:MFS transporter [Streptomyces sp. SN-593]BBA97122.1 putative MFS transporter [Streptomyces sp. SN-593]
MESASDQAQDTETPGEAPDPLRWWSLLAVSLATFMTYLDLNVINVAIPTIQRDLHLSEAGLEWIVSSYLLTLAGLLLAGGRLADAYGRRRLYMIGLTVFTLSSLSAGLAGNGGMLIGSRAVQGIGAALLTPATLAIITATFTDLKERTSAIGLWTVSAALGLALGPVTGGLITQNIRWGWIFLINVPVGVVTLALSARTVRESRSSDSGNVLDVGGLITSAVALFAVTYALIEGNDAGWGAPEIVTAFVIAAIATVAFFVFETRTPEPMVNLGLFRIRQFTGGISTQMIWAFGALAIYFFTSMYLQDVLGFSPLKSGVLFVPMAFALAAFAGFSTLMESWIGGFRTVSLGMVMMTVGLIMLNMHDEHSTFASLLPCLIVLGGGMGIMNVPMTNAVMHNTPKAQAGVASALLNDAREVAGLLGITIIGAVLRSKQASELRSGSSASQSFLSGYHVGLWVATGLVAVGIVFTYVMLRPSGEPLLDEDAVPAPLT